MNELNDDNDIVIKDINDNNNNNNIYDDDIKEDEFKDLSHTNSYNSQTSSYDSDGNLKQSKIKLNKDGLLEDWKKPESFDDICKIDKPIDYIDSRIIYTNCIERYFFYNNMTGVLKTGFVTDSKYRIHGLCYRKYQIAIEKKEILDLINFRSEKYNMDIPDELIRFILNDEYGIMKQSCEQELLELQNSTAGVGVYKSKTKVQIPDGYSIPNSSELPIDLNINEYPYNFGIILKRENITDKLFFLCCGNDDCRGVGRKKQTIMDIIIMKKNAPKDYYMPKRLYSPMIPEEKELRYTLVDEHLRLKHWNQLNQIKEFDVNICNQRKQLEKLEKKEKLIVTNKRK